MTGLRRRTSSTFATLIAGALLVTLTGGIAFAQVTLVVDPYQGIDWDATGQYKANLHTHTTESDGRMDPAVVIDEYHERGYDALAITDHNLCTWPWEDHGRSSEDLGMLAIPGNELSRHHHSLALFADFEHSSRDIDEVMAALAEAHGLGVLCHPAMHWPRDHGPASGLRVEMQPPLREVTRGDFTIEAWFRTTDQRRHILAGNYRPDQRGALNLELHTDNRVRVYAQPTEGATVDLNLSAEPLGIDTRDGEWHHLAGVRDGDVVRLFLDGRLLGETEDVAGAYDLHGDAYFIGRDHRTGGTILRGDLDHVRLWRRALSADEIAQIHSGAVPGRRAAPSAADMLLQYTFEPLTPETLRTLEPLDADTFADSAGHPDGPFHAVASPDASPAYIDDVAENLSGYEASSRALHFDQPPPMDYVPDDAVAEYVTLFERHPHLLGMEVLNGTRPAHEYALDRELWDHLLSELMPERPVWGFATDDMHGMGHLGRDWVVVLTGELDIPSVRAAIESGAWYFSTIRLRPAEEASVEGTPRIEGIAHDADAGRITIEATAGGEALSDDAYQWVSHGEIVHIGPTLNYRETDGIGSYVRAELTAAGGLTLTNPFGLRAE